ncbi:MAG: pyrroline-5-carboxylate reductase [Planctomycetaceae bacterium]|nr:pyrroline-5-carboxylate reductase [Planctomycetaceae bacterium]
MATALALGFHRSDMVGKDKLFASDAVAVNGQRFADSTGATLCSTNVELYETVDVLFLAVKPQQMGDVLEEFSERDDCGCKLFVTIAAGLPLSFYRRCLGSDARIVRVMPNTPCLVGKGASAFAVSEAVTQDDIAVVRVLLETVGAVEQVPERLLNAVTGLSGSGPAYVCMIIEAMSDAGVSMGLPRAMATTFAAKTLLGTAEMVLQTGEHPAVLKDRVTSPGGTTIAGIHALEAHGLRATIIAGIQAATERAGELSDG